MSSIGSGRNLVGEGEVVRLAVRRIIRTLPPIERRVICWLYGIGCTPLDPVEVADRLNMSVEQVWRHVSHAVEQVGFQAISEVAA